MVRPVVLGGSAGVLCALVVLGCGPRRTDMGEGIEVAPTPPAPETKGEAGEPSSGPSDSSRELIAETDRRIPVERPIATQIDIHPGEAWFAHRADGLGISLAKVRARDKKFDDTRPPGSEFWDQQLAKEVWGLWTGLCNECHGGTRTLEEVVSLPPPPKAWGRTKGVFFGVEKSPSQVYRTVTFGKVKAGRKINMPNWQGKLSKEQIWGLLYFIETSSKKATSRRSNP